MKFKDNKRIFDVNRGETSKEIIYNLNDRILELETTLKLVSSDCKINNILISTLIEIIMRNNLTTDDEFYNIFNEYTKLFEKDTKEIEDQKKVDFIKKIMLQPIDDTIPIN